MGIGRRMQSLALQRPRWRWGVLLPGLLVAGGQLAVAGPQTPADPQTKPAATSRALSAQASVSACSHGVWTGTLGNTPISIRLFVNGEGQAVGRYYYRASLGDLFLKREPDTLEWQERDAAGLATGRLRLSCDGQQLLGEWRSMDGMRRLAVTGVSAEEDQYSLARRMALKPRVASRGTVQRQAFERLSYGAQAEGIQGLRLVGKEAGLEALNAALQEEATQAVLDHLDCKAKEVLDPGPCDRFDSDLEQKVLARSDVHVVIRSHSDGFCGGGASWRETEIRTYRVDTGAPVDVSHWLHPDYQQRIATDSALHRLLMQVYQSSPYADMAGCKDVMAWSPKDVHGLPGRLVFVSLSGKGTLSGECSAEVEVPLPRIQPFLSPSGKQALAAFR